MSSELNPQNQSETAHQNVQSVAVSPLKYQWYLWLLALSFFTRIPVKLPTHLSNEMLRGMLHHASRYFALVGFVIGLSSAAVYFFAQIIFPEHISIIMTMAFGLLLTGAFHEDGWADVWDGFGGGWSLEQKLNIMKDSRLGTYGASALFFILLIKFFSLYELADYSNGLPIIALVVAHTLSRVVATSLIADMPYVAEDATSKVKPLAQQLSANGLLCLLATGLVVALLCLPWVVVVKLSIVLLITRSLIKLWFNKQLGGYTGDCLGAAQQLTEVVIYLSFIVWFT